MIQLLYFKHISLRVGKARQIEKRSARSPPIKQVFFLCKITNFTISQDICTRFARYSQSTQCSWIIRQSIKSIKLTSPSRSSPYKMNVSKSLRRTKLWPFKDVRSSIFLTSVEPICNIVIREIKPDV